MPDLPAGLRLLKHPCSRTNDAFAAEALPCLDSGAGLPPVAAACAVLTQLCCSAQLLKQHTRRLRSSEAKGGSAALLFRSPELRSLFHTSSQACAPRRRHISLLRSFVAEGGSATLAAAHTILEIYRVSDMSLARVLPSAQDEVNAAAFHPFPVRPLDLHPLTLVHLCVFSKCGPEVSPLRLSSHCARSLIAAAFHLFPGYGLCSQASDLAFHPLTGCSKAYAGVKHCNCTAVLRKLIFSATHHCHQRVVHFSCMPGLACSCYSRFEAARPVRVPCARAVAATGRCRCASHGVETHQQSHA